jgi:hypothetical protein
MNFINFVGDMSQDIPVWANVVGRLRVEVAQVLGPKQLLMDAQANQVLGLKFGSSSGKALPTHLSWTFFGTLSVTDMTSFLSAADRLTALVDTWFGRTPAVALRLVIEQLRRAMTPDPEQCNDTQLGTLDAIDVLNHALHLKYNEAVIAPPESANARWDRILASIPTGSYWNNLSRVHQRNALITLARSPAQKRALGADAPPGSNRSPAAPTKRCRFQDQLSGCPFGTACRGAHDADKPKTDKPAKSPVTPKPVPPKAANSGSK